MSRKHVPSTPELAGPEATLAARLGPSWRVVEAAGRGATATVYKALHLDANGRADGTMAALKVAGEEDQNGTPTSWLGREASLVASLARRWGPALLDAGPGWVATTWAEGEPLTVGGRADTDSARRSELAAIVAHGVGRALDELHALSVRHGDVKPANILVTGTTPTRDRARERGATLIDLGLAARVTGAAAAGGTPRYLAPELLRGEPATPAADLYALGIVLAEVLDPAVAAASDPRAAAAAIAAPFGAWIAALLAEAPGARPSATWIAARAAHVLGLERDREEAIEARRARVRRAYLAVRADELAPGAVIAESIGGAPRQWLEEAIVMTTHLASRASLAADPDARGAPVTSEITPLDALGIARWVVGVVGPIASSWPLPTFTERDLADRLDTLAAHSSPEAWTLEDLAGEAPRLNDAPASSSNGDPDARDRWLVLTRELLAARPRADVLVAAENEIARGAAPASFVLDLGLALLRRGEIGRAFAAVASAPQDGGDLTLLRAELARRRGDLAGAEQDARQALGAGAGTDAARALLGRLAWDAGAVDRAERELGDARGANAAEVRGLIAYSRGDYDRGLRALAVESARAESPVALARLEGTRGMLEHARGAAEQSLAAFASAVDLATRSGAVVEEASYLTGLAAAAVDAAAIGRALGASTRAALLWERLDRPAFAARALLGRAAAYAVVGASHEADDAAKVASARARASGDLRAAAFARWAIAETRAPGDERAALEVRAADEELTRALPEDRIRSAARLLVWAEGITTGGTRVDVEAIDARASASSATARWEWWGARALAALASGEAQLVSPRVLAELVALLDIAAPLGSRGPALAAGARLAAELGDGDVARRLETARRVAAETLRSGCPPEHRASLAGVPWARTGDDASTSASGSPGAMGAMGAMGAAQVEQLDAIVRALASRDRLKPLLEQVLDTMVLWTGVERGLLLLRAPDGGLVPRVARNLARRDLRGEQLALSMGLAKRAMEERQAICATDAYAQVGDLHASVHALRLRSVLAVPLVARGDVLGVVYLDDRVRRGAFGNAELAWVRLVASQAALAIADARDQALLRRAVRRAERANARLAADLGKRDAELVAMRAELTQDGDTRFRYDEIAGRSEPMRAMLRVVDRVTASDVPVLLAGESGTGKELVARAIHANGGRSARAFVSENCASVPETLLETTLFGHMRGAFTGASSTRAGLFDVADGGTLFLDEIGEMPLSMQTKLLRVLQNGEVRPVGGEKTHRVDVRIIGATHRDLEAMVAAGTFREDLFYRLNVVSIRVPPLRERTTDIPLLVAHFVEKHAAGRKMKVTRAAMDRLAGFPWPGNVRQLENEIRRAFVLADDRIDVGELSDEVARGGPNAARSAGLGLKARVDALEAQLVKDALERTKGNQTRAAETLGISRFGLQKMMRRLGVRAPGSGS